MAIAASDVGIKNTKFAHCAICWSKFINNDKSKINIVPPPIPKPVTIPAIIPKIIGNIFPLLKIGY